MQNRKRDTYVQNRLLDSVGEGEGGMFQENSIYIIYSKTDHQPRLDAWDKCSGLVYWEDPEQSGWGIHVNPRLIHVNVWQKPLQYCEVISLQLIKINGKKIIWTIQMKLLKMKYKIWKKKESIRLAHFLRHISHISRCSGLHEAGGFVVVQLLSRVGLFSTPWTAARQASLSIGCPKQEHWPGLPRPPPAELPDQGSNPRLLHWQVDSLPLTHQGSPVESTVIEHFHHHGKFYWTVRYLKWQTSLKQTVKNRKQIS